MTATDTMLSRKEGRVGYLIVPRPMVVAFTRAKWLVDRHTPLHQQAALRDFMKEVRGAMEFMRAHGVTVEPIEKSVVEG